MSYRIDYGSREALRMPLKPKRPLSALAAAFCVLALVAGAMTVKHAGLSWVETYLLPGDPAVTAAALENLAKDLREGESLSDAVTAFCQEIMDHAD